MGKKTIADVEVAGRTVFMRVDFNVPVEEGRILDDRRLRLALDSIGEVIDRGGRLILASHLGRPKGQGFEPELSLAPCARRLSELLNRPVCLAPDCQGPIVEQMVRELRDGQVILLENLRFHEGELLNDERFARPWAAWTEVYCNEAFATAHRAHASLAALPAMLADRPRVAGLNLERELRNLEAILHPVQRPFVLILGGSRVADRIGALLNLLRQVDTILVGGSVAHALMQAEGRQVGESEIDPVDVAEARRVLDAAGKLRSRLLLPEDHVCAAAGGRAAETRVFEEHIPTGWVGLDIGPRTVVRYTQIIRQAQTIFWIGPMGVWENPPYDVGTKMIGLSVVHATLVHQARSVVAGASLSLAIERFGLQANITHISNGGAATLALLEGSPLPALEYLEEVVSAARAVPAERAGVG